MERLAVIGGGAWGTALAAVLVRAGRRVALWAREDEVVEAINGGHENTTFLPGIALDPAITATRDIIAALAGAEAVLLVAPAQHLGAVSEAMATGLAADIPVVICAKGIETESGRLMSEVLEAVRGPGPIAVLSGPTFAAEVARDLPAAVTLATPDAALGDALVAAIGTPRFRTYYSDDLIGAQIGGAIKNVIAIGCGIVAGRRLGDNARAALITRGLAEMVRLGVAKGGRAETLMGLSGLGDLVLTCTGMQSRNLSLGHALGEGRALDEILGERRSVAEGVHSAAAVHRLAGRLGIDMPIVAAVDAILHGKEDVEDVIEALLARPFRSEAAAG